MLIVKSLRKLLESCLLLGVIKIALNKSDIMIIEEIIDQINDYNDSTKSISKSLLEGNNLLLMETLLKLKKGNLKKILSYNNPKKNKKKNKKKENINDFKFSMIEILKIFEQKSNEEIEKKYSLNDLRSMYLTIYEVKSPSKDTKGDLVSTIRNYIYGRKRADSFREDI